MNITQISRVLVVVALAWVVSGCIATQPVPTYALSGDIVQVAVGGIKRNTNGGTLRAADVTATITDVTSASYDVKVVGLFRSYPDYTSLYSQFVLDRNDTFFGAVEPYDGMWWVTLRLVDTANDPLDLKKGPATIAVSSGQLLDTGWQYEGSLGSYPIEILEDASIRTRIPTAEEEQQYTSYRPLVSLTIGPDNLTGVNSVGGFQVKLTYANAALFVAPGAAAAKVPPRLVPVSHDPNLTVIQSTADNGDGTSTLTAMVTNPSGFVPDSTPAVDVSNPAVDEWAIGKSTFRDLQFAIVVQDTSDLADGWEANYNLVAGDSYYIDLNGDEIFGVNPLLGRSFAP